MGRVVVVVVTVVLTVIIWLVHSRVPTLTGLMRLPFPS